MSAGLPTNFIRVPELTIEEVSPKNLATNLDSFLKQSQLLSRDLNNIRLIKMVWKPLPENVEFRWQNDKFLLTTKCYRVNIYRSEDGRRWPETPLTLQPIQKALFCCQNCIESGSLSCALVDRSGNESLPSKKIIMHRKFLQNWMIHFSILINCWVHKSEFPIAATSEPCKC